MVEARLQGTTLDILLIDNARGIDAPTLAKLEQSLIQATATAQLPTADVGIGIVNIDRRIKLLFGEQYGVTLQVVRGVGTTVSLHLPYQCADAVVAQEKAIAIRFES
jgi:two-component system, sensor histidine kinase YesM